MKTRLLALRHSLFFWRTDELSRAILGGMLTVAMVTLVAKAVGFAKELVVAGQFGTSDVMDAFTTAFVIWGFIAGVMGGGLPDALAPVYSRLMQRNRAEADELAVTSFWIYAALMLVVGICVLCLGRFIVPLCASAYAPEKQAMTLRFFYWLAPFGFFWAISLLLTMLLQANKRFALASLAPATVPAFSILFLWGLAPSVGIWALIWGTVIGASVQLSLLSWRFFGAHCRRSLVRPGSWNPEAREVFRETWPMLGAGLTAGAATVIDLAMAAWLEPGSVAVLAYGEKICAIILALAATATSQAFLPFLSDLVAQNRWRVLRGTVMRFSSIIAALSLPLIGFFWGFSEWIVQSLFERGEFTAEDTVRVAGVLRYCSLQIPFFILAVLASRVLVAMQASRYLFATTVVTLAANVLGNYLLIQTMGVAGIALSTAIVYFLSTAMLYGFIFRAVARKVRAFQLDDDE